MRLCRNKFWLCATSQVSSLGRPMSWLVGRLCAGPPPMPVPISAFSQNDERGEKEEADENDDEEENDGAATGQGGWRMSIAEHFASM